MPTNIVQMAAEYSNAVMVAVLPLFSDFAKKLDLPIPTPITASQIEKFYPSPFIDHPCPSVKLTNGYAFYLSPLGYVAGFTGPSNFYTAGDLDRTNLMRYIGKPNMTTNEAIVVAIGSLKKLGYKPQWFNAERPPDHFEEPFDTELGTVPFCKMSWGGENVGDTYYAVAVDMRRRQMMDMSITVSTDFLRTNPISTPLKVEVGK